MERICSIIYVQRDCAYVIKGFKGPTEIKPRDFHLQNPFYHGLGPIFEFRSMTDWLGVVTSVRTQAM